MLDNRFIVVEISDVNLQAVDHSYIDTFTDNEGGGAAAAAAKSAAAIAARKAKAAAAFVAKKAAHDKAMVSCRS